MEINPWSKLVDTPDDRIWRGALLRLPGKPHYEEVVDFLIIEYDGGLALLVASGYKAGIVRQIMPAAAFDSSGARALSRRWLVENWSQWIGLGDPTDIWIRRDPPVPDSLPDEIDECTQGRGDQAPA
jgi:hypothetical protein